MHTAPHPITPMSSPTMNVGFRTSSASRPTDQRSIRLFAAIGLVAVPVAGVFATTTIDPMDSGTQLMLAGGFIALGFGSLVALMTTCRFGDRTSAH